MTDINIDGNNIRISRKKLTLTQENILNNKMSEIDTWPFLPSGLIDEEKMPRDEIDKISKRQINSITRAKELAEKVKDKQNMIMTWILAVLIGIVGNFLVNLIFGPLNFTELPVGIFMLMSLILIALILAVFFYLPVTINSKTSFITPWKYPSNFFIELPPDELTSKAKAFTSYSVSFRDKIVEFTNLISLCILRDKLTNCKWKRLKINSIEPISSQPVYMFDVDFKSKLFFLHPNMAPELFEELQSFYVHFYGVHIDIGVHKIDRNEKRWNNRGPAFFNEIITWDMKELTKKVKEQIRS